MTIAAEMPTPINAPAIMPAAPKASARTRNAAVMNRPAPPIICAQPSQKKSCRPCTTPENSGTHNETSSNGSVTSSPAAPGSCQRWTRR